MSKSRSRETNWKVVSVTGEKLVGSHQGGCSGGGEKWSDSADVLMEEPLGFLNRLLWT